MTASIPLRPITKLTVLIDACVYRHNPQVGDQLASMFKMLKASGVECEVQQDRFCLTEATSCAHELMLAEERSHKREAETGIGIKRISKHPSPEHIQNFVNITEAIGEQAPIRYVTSPSVAATMEQRKEMAKEYLFNDPRFENWPQVLSDILSRRVQYNEVDEYYEALYTTTMKASHIINGIHDLMKHERGFKERITPQDKEDFLLHRHKEGKRVFWEEIDLTKMNASNIPLVIADSFLKTKYCLKLLGRSGELTPLGQHMLDSGMNRGEKVMEEQARHIVATTKVMPPTRHAVLLITDDGKAHSDMQKLHREHPNCTPITSRELAGMVGKLAERPQIRPFFDDRTLQIAQDVANGVIIQNSPLFRSQEQIKSGDTSFANRLIVTNALPSDIRSRL